MMDVVSVNNAEHYSWGNNCDGWHLLKRDDLSIIQEEVPPGEAEVKHYHVKAKQFFYVLQGTAVIIAYGKENILEANEGLFIDAGVEHQLVNKSNVLLKFIVISSPKSHGDRVVTQIPE